MTEKLTGTLSLNTNKQSSKEKELTSIIYGVCSKCIQVIYTLNTNYSKYHDLGSSVYPRYFVQMHSSVKYSQKIYTKVRPDIKIIAHADFQIFFVHEIALVYKKGHNSVKYLQNFVKSTSSSTPWTQTVC